jgi:D-glycero-D-manno-heptose 1,7-bisphosphate phosphatase
VVAGGLGTRLRALPGAEVKVLAPVGGEPFLAVLLRRLAALDVRHVHLCLGHGAARVRAWLASASAPVRVTTTVETEPLGVFGALQLALPYVGDPAVLAYGDVLPTTPPGALADALRPGVRGAVAAWANADRGEPSNLLVRDGMVVRYVKGVAGLTHVDVGMTALRRDVVAELPEGRLLSESDVLPRLAADGVLAAYEVDGPNPHIGDPAHYGAVLESVGDDAVRMPPGLLLLDRDGVLLEHVDPYVLRAEDVRFVPGAAEAAAAFAHAGSRLAVVSNQSPIARGLVTEAFVERTNAMVVARLAELGVADVPVHYCPHDDTARCACRKPEPGLLRTAMAAAGAEPSRTWMAGDHDVDLVAAARAGCGARIHVLTGRMRRASVHATHVAANLPALARACGLVRGSA